MRGSPDAALTPSLTPPTLNLTGADLPHISSSRGRGREHWLTHTYTHTHLQSSHTHTLYTHFSGGLLLSVFLSSSLHSLFPCLCTGDPRSLLNQCKHTNARPPQHGCVAAERGVDPGPRPHPSASAAIMIGRRGSQGPCL